MYTRSGLVLVLPDNFYSHFPRIYLDAEIWYFYTFLSDHTAGVRGEEEGERDRKRITEWINI
jgi:hypothetical protein